MYYLGTGLIFLSFIGLTLADSTSQVEEEKSKPAKNESKSKVKKEKLN